MLVYTNEMGNIYFFDVTDGTELLKYIDVKYIRDFFKQVNEINIFLFLSRKFLLITKMLFAKCFSWIHTIST